MTTPHPMAAVPVIITGPPGSGKTRHAQALARHYRKRWVRDEWTPGEGSPLTADTLALTCDAPSPSSAFNVIPIAEALRAAGITEA